MRNKKQKFLYSVVSLLLCVSMFVGTTYAWFTDSVQSGMNTIYAGNLDVELLADGVEVDENTTLFDDVALWEPGVVVYENLQVVNKGSLALQYQMTLNFGNENDLNGHKLSEVLKVAVIDKIDAGADRQTVLTAAKAANPTSLYNFYVYGALEAETSAEEQTVVIFWEPSSPEIDNLYNANNGQLTSDGEPLHIEFGVKLQATQAVSDNEKDSFGSDYDAGADFGPFLNGIVTAKVLVENGYTTEETVLAGKGFRAIVPAGVKVSDGVEELTLKIRDKGASDSNVKLEENEEIRPLDVHIDGVAADNEKVIEVVVEKALSTGLNMGNFALYHVENGVDNKMTPSDTPVNHNDFNYDPATGDVKMTLKSFSEVALVAEAAKWEGNRDYSWYDASATVLTIANADQLAGFSAIVGGMDGQTADTFADKTVKLVADIVIGDTDSENKFMFYPIGYYNNTESYEKKSGGSVSSWHKEFSGTFDGNGHTISDFYQNTWEAFGDYNDGYSGTPNHNRDGFGLFGKVYGGTIRNLTVKNFSSDGEYGTTGTIAAYAEGANFENIAIIGCNPRVYNIGNGGIVGCVGWYAKDAGLKTNFKNITVDNTNKISALWGSWDVACGGILGQYYPTSGQSSANYPKNGGIHFENCHVAAQIDVYNDVCANYQYYAYRYAGILLGSVRENVTQNGHVYPNMNGITARECTVHFGDWNDYYYCELVANTLASYTHDHQMSRLEQVTSVDVDAKKVVTLKGETKDIPSGRVNYVVVKAKDADGKWIHGDGTDFATCYHFVNGAVWNHEDAGTEIVDNKEVLKEDKQLIYREFNNLVTGYGWGATSLGVNDMDGVTILDRLEGDSVQKFVVKDGFSAGTSITSGVAVKVGDVFAAVAGASPAINNQTTSVFVSPADKNSTVSCEYNPDYSNWANGDLKFSGVGAATITITDYYFCKSTSVTVNFVGVNSLVVLFSKNTYDVSKNEKFKSDDIQVYAIHEDNTFRQLAYGSGAGKYILTKVPNPNTVGSHIGTVSYTFEGKTVAADFTVYGVNFADAGNSVTLTGDIGLHFDYFSVKGGYEGRIMYGGGSKDYGNGLSAIYKNSNNLAGGNMAGQVVINNAQLADPIHLSGWVGYGEDFDTFGMYVNGDTSTLKAFNKFMDAESPVNTDAYAGQYAKRFYFNGIDLKSLNLYDGENTITFVSVHEKGLKILTEWTIYWNCTLDTNISAKSANVIILAGQSNAYGVSPYDNATSTKVANTDFSNIRIRYTNLGNSSADIANANWVTISESGGGAFEQFAPGVGGPNALLFGPELALANYLATNANTKDEVWYIIKYTAAGSLLNGDWYDGTVERTVTLNGKTTFLMPAMLTFVEESLSTIKKTHGDNVNMSAFMWMQGESEAGDGSGSWAQGYDKLEQTLVSDVRNKVSAYSGTLKFIDAEIAAYNEDANNWIYANNGTYTYQGNTFNVTNGVNDQKKANAAKIWNTSSNSVQNNSGAGISNSIYFTTNTLTTKADDSAHYDAESMWKLGTWFAEAMYK